MNTNYYMRSPELPEAKVHVGKRLWDGPERGMCFVWAMARERFEELHTEHGKYPEVVEVVDEYGESYSLYRFANEVLEDIRVHEEALVGREFS